VVRRAQADRVARAAAPSFVAHALDLEHYALAAVVPESHALALVVLDRSGPAVSDDERDVVQFFAHLVGLAITRVVLRIRIREMTREIRHLTASATALIHEAQVAPITLTTDLGQGPVFTAAGLRTPRASELAELLSNHEREIADRMAAGRSNREIGEELHLALGTVKEHVAQVLRKLGASNRVEAVARYIELRARVG
jgi:DNA-binding CsgD family transcriptional regulator